MTKLPASEHRKTTAPTISPGCAQRPSALLAASPEYHPGIGWLPAARLLVVHVATPLESGSPEHPGMDTPLSWKSTVPVGEGPVATTVNVTGWPTLAVYDEASRGSP